MVGLNTSTRLRAIMARRSRLISSSLLPENIGPQITSIHPILPVMMSIRIVKHVTTAAPNPVARFSGDGVSQYAIDVSGCGQRTERAAPISGQPRGTEGVRHG